MLIVAEHASARFGGEAALPMHYFRVLRSRNVETWLIVHERTADELKEQFAADSDRMYFIPDTWLHRLLWKIGGMLPAQLESFTFGFLLRLLTQLAERRLARRLIQQHGIDVVHQPIPVSPKEPSLMHGLGRPVVIGPMNGGIDYPPAFRAMHRPGVGAFLALGRLGSHLVNVLIPGKRRAAALLVANSRTRAALPRGHAPRVVELVENGVDLSLWQSREPDAPGAGPDSHTDIVEFVFVGRLVDWKAVDLLLEAFATLADDVAARSRLRVVGDGPERPHLLDLARELGLGDRVCFDGWLPQTQCALRLGDADVLVLPSLRECGGAVVLEAMAMSKPVIATNWGGPADYLDGSCGLLVDPSSRSAFVSGLARAIARLACDADLRRSLGTAGRRKVEARYDWEAKLDVVMAIYRQAVTVR